MSSNHDRWSNDRRPQYRQYGQESRSTPTPYEWYDSEHNGSSQQHDTHYRNRESSAPKYHQWPQYGYDDQVYKQYHQSYGTTNQRSSTYDEGKYTASNTTDSDKQSQSDEITRTKAAPRRSMPSSSKNSQKRWHLSKEFQAFVRSSGTDTLLLLDDYCRPLNASKELCAFLQSLPGTSDNKNRIRGVITASKDGRWLALVACNDAGTAKALAIDIKDHAKDIEAKFVTNQVFHTSSQVQKVSLAEGLRQCFLKEGVLLDEWSSPKNSESVEAVRSERNIDQQFALPDNISRDHRNITSANPLSYAKKAASHISRWNAQQEELQKNDVAESSAPADLQRTNSGKLSVDVQTSEQFNYLDEEKKACLLCQRQFKTLEVLRRHSIESDLHKKNLQDQDRCSEGRKRKIASTAVADSVTSTGMKKAGFAPVRQSDTSDTRDDATSEGMPTSGSSTEYRDRAAERRIVFGTEAIAKAKAMAKKRPFSDDATLEYALPAKLDETSIGGALLAKMGWTAGKGLGSDGGGRTDPIITHVYAPRVGIGSQRNNKFAPTVEEYSSKHTKFVHGGKAYERSARMQERYNT